MAVLEQIRVKAGALVSIIIALALLSFLVDPSTLESALNSMSSKYDVGQIAGKTVSYTDFQNDVDRYTTINQIMSGSSVSSEAQQNQIREAAWQELINRYMFIKNAKAAGITVGEAEMVALTTGESASPLIAQNPAFMDENGNFSKEALVNFVNAASTDENLKVYWNYIQNTILTQQYYAKYGSLFNASLIDNALMMDETLASNNTTADVNIVMVPRSFDRDSTITVSGAEVKKFYNDHKDLYFKQNASRDIEYVVFEVVPSAEDIAATNDKVTEIYDEFAATENMKSFLLKNSDRSLSDHWYKAGELNDVATGITEFVDSNNSGVSPVCSKDNTFYAARIMATANIPDSVYVKHILLQGADAAKTADSLVTAISKGASFSSNVALFSADQNSAADGELGNIGWMTQTYMIPGFESVITAEVGKPFVLNTPYGTHVVLVSKKTAPVLKKQVAVLEKTALASKETFNNYYSQANRFATIAGGKLDGYKKAVDSLGVYSHALNRLTEATTNYGSVESAKEVTRWIFDAKKGKSSEIITVNNNFFFVVALKDIHKEGYAPVNDVANQIQQRLYEEKYAEKVCEEAAVKTAGLTTLAEVADKLGATVMENQQLSYAAINNYSIMDPALLGAVAKAETGKLVGPVKGDTGAYYFQVNSVDKGEFFTEDDAKLLSSQKAQYNSQRLLPVMMEKADVKDNRARFY